MYFFFNDTATTEIYTLSLHDALPIWTALRRTESWRTGFSLKAWKATSRSGGASWAWSSTSAATIKTSRSEEHTSELQSPCNLVCRLLLEKKKIKISRSRPQQFAST